jgi:F-type H+-transporting ATPase subunit delta
MSELTVASRYAKSLIDLAEEQKTLDEVKNDMVFIMQTLKQNSELKAVFGSPVISHSKKIAILNDVFSKGINKVTAGFFTLMINKGRGELVYPTAQEYIDQYDAKKGITKASIVSATPLSAANKDQIVAEVKAAVGGEIDLDTKVDPELIGGFVLTVGDRQLDTSVAGSLKKLKKDFASGMVKS